MIEVSINGASLASIAKFTDIKKTALKHARFAASVLANAIASLDIAKNPADSAIIKSIREEYDGYVSLSMIDSIKCAMVFDNCHFLEDMDVRHPLAVTVSHVFFVSVGLYEDMGDRLTVSQYPLYGSRTTIKGRNNYESALVFYNESSSTVVKALARLYVDDVAEFEKLYQYILRRI